MEFSLNVVGPDFEKADLVGFDFADASVALRLPEHWGRYPPTLAGSDLTALDAFSGKVDKHPFGYLYRMLVKQCWFYSDKASENHVMLCDFFIEHMQLTDREVECRTHLNQNALNNWLMNYLRLIAVEGDETLLNTPAEAEALVAAEIPPSIDQFEFHDAQNIRWPIVTLGNGSGIPPEWRIYAPLNREAVLEIRCDIQVFSSDHDSITIPRDQIDQLRRDIRDEILSHIHITYSPELLAELG